MKAKIKLQKKSVGYIANVNVTKGNQTIIIKSFG